MASCRTTYDKPRKQSYLTRVEHHPNYQEACSTRPFTLRKSATAMKEQQSLWTWAVLDFYSFRPLITQLSLLTIMAPWNLLLTRVLVTKQRVRTWDNRYVNVHLLLITLEALNSDPYSSGNEQFYPLRSIRSVRL